MFVESISKLEWPQTFVVLWKLTFVSVKNTNHWKKYFKIIMCFQISPRSPDKGNVFFLNATFELGEGDFKQLWSWIFLDQEVSLQDMEKWSPTGLNTNQRQLRSLEFIPAVHHGGRLDSACDLLWGWREGCSLLPNVKVLGESRDICMGQLVWAVLVSQGWQPDQCWAAAPHAWGSQKPTTLPSWRWFSSRTGWVLLF